MYNAEQMPRLEVQSVTVRKVDGGLNEVTAVIGNRGAIPTHLEIDLQEKLTRPDWVSISSPRRESVRVLAGFIGNNQFFFHTTEQKHQPQRIELANIGGNGAAYVRWLVADDGPYTVTVDSVKGGRASRGIN
jgi:hypothetical protein